MKEEAIEADPTAVGKFPHTVYRFFATTCLLSDCLYLVCKLSRLLQAEKIDFADVSMLVENTCAALLSMKHSPGPKASRICVFN